MGEGLTPSWRFCTHYWYLLGTKIRGYQLLHAICWFYFFVATLWGKLVYCCMSCDQCYSFLLGHCWFHGRHWSIRETSGWVLLVVFCTHHCRCFYTLQFSFGTTLGPWNGVVVFVESSFPSPVYFWTVFWGPLFIFLAQPDRCSDMMHAFWWLVFSFCTYHTSGIPLGP